MYKYVYVNCNIMYKYMYVNCNIMYKYMLVETILHSALYIQ